MNDDAWFRKQQTELMSCTVRNSIGVTQQTTPSHLIYFGSAAGVLGALAMSVFNRLYSQGQNRLKKLEESQRKRSTLKDPNCTFAPVTNHNSSNSNTGGGNASRKRRRPKQLPKVEDVLEAIVQTVEAGTDHSGAVSVELYGQVLANVMSTIRDRRGNEDALIATTEDKARRAEKQSNKSLSSKSNEERFKSLYQDAQDQRAKASKLRQEHSNRLPADCTFSPRINRYKGAGQNDAGSRGDKLYEELYKGAQRHLEKKDKLHAEAKKKAPQHCTFKPRINRSSGNSTSSTPGQSRFSRLYNDGAAKRKQRKDEIAARKLEVERLRREEDTIAPPLPESIATSRGAARVKRANQQQRAASSKSRAGAEAAAPNQHIQKHAPDATIDGADVPESESITPEKKSRSFFSRGKKKKKKPKKKKKKMSKVHEASIKKKQDKAKAKRQGDGGGKGGGAGKDEGKKTVPASSSVAFNSSLPPFNTRAKSKNDSFAVVNTLGLEQCTFSPQICRTGPKDNREGTVFTRLQKQSKARQERARQREKANPHGCTFRPAITLLAGGEKESKTKRFERLYKDHEKRLQKQGTSKTQLPMGCTFAPDVTMSKSTFENNGEVEVARKPARPRKPKGIVVVERPKSEGRVLVSGGDFKEGERKAAATVPLKEEEKEAVVMAVADHVKEEVVERKAAATAAPLKEEKKEAVAMAVADHVKEEVGERKAAAAVPLKEEKKEAVAMSVAGHVKKETGERQAAAAVPLKEGKKEAVAMSVSDHVKKESEPAVEAKPSAEATPVPVVAEKAKPINTTLIDTEPAAMITTEVKPEEAKPEEVKPEEAKPIAEGKPTTEAKPTTPAKPTADVKPPGEKPVPVIK